MRLISALAALVLAAGAAQAQTPAEAAPAAADLAKLRAEGDALLTAGGAQAFFVNETGTRGGVILLRHTPSGYVCMFNPGAPANRVSVYPHPQPGHNVGCGTSTVTGTQTRYFTYAPEAEITEEMALEGAVADIRRRFPDAQPAPAQSAPNPGVSLVLPVGAPRPKVAILSRAEADERVEVGKRDGWLVKFRYTAPPGVGRQGGVLDTFWFTTVLERDRRRANPAAPASPAAPPAVQGPALPFGLQPVPKQPIEQQRADVLRIIEASGASGKFEAVERDGQVMYGHRASGLTCSFQPTNGRLAIGDPAREVAACITLDPTGRHTTTLGVQRNSNRLDANRALRALVQGLSRDGRLRPASGPALSASVGAKSGLPPHSSAGLEGSGDSGPTYVRASAAIVGDWLLTEVSDRPAGDRIEADLMVEIGFIVALQRMVEAQQTGR